MSDQKLFHARILDAALANAEHVALSDAETGESLSYSALRARSLALARILRAQYALHRGDAVLCVMPNNIHYPVIFLAAASIGAPFCGACATSTKPEIDALIELTACRAIFTTSELLEKVIQKSADIPVFVLGKLYGQHGVDLEETFEEISAENFNTNTGGAAVADNNHSHSAENAAEEAAASAAADDVLLMALSSGTTGTPKCALLTHRNFNAATDALKSAVFDALSARGAVSRATVALLPFYHASGFWALCYCLLSGHHSVVMNRFDATIFLRAVSAHAVDTVNVVPSIINFLVKNGAELVERLGLDLSSVRTILCGSAAISNDQVDEFLRLFPRVNNFLRGYGMTEVVLLSHMTPLDLTRQKIQNHANSCGKLLPGFEAKIVDTETGAEIREPQTPGELWLRSDSVMRGYLRDERETRMCLDAEGFLHTGDILHFDADGFYYVDGRLKNMIKVNGMQVSPVELENILLSHSDVLEAAVVGVGDADRGEVPKAFVVLAASYAPGTQIDAKLCEVRDFVNARVAPFKQLAGGVFALATLPKTSSGKIAKARLSAQLAACEASKPLAPIAEEHHQQTDNFTREAAASTAVASCCGSAGLDEDGEQETIL